MIKINGQEVVFEKFPNGETRLVHESISNDVIAKAFPNVHFKYENDSDLIKLMFVKEFLDSLKYITSTLTIYYMPYSRMDRSENGSPFTLKYVANFINGLNFDKVIVIEPHSDVTTALLDRAEAKYINFDLIEKVKKEIGFDEENDSIMFPDAGASKRYSKMKAKNVIIGNKVRNFETGEILGLDLIRNNVGSTGNKVLIVDDLSSYGGTFVHSAKRLKAEMFEEIYLLVAHAENSIFEGELFNNVTGVFTTDSILSQQNYWKNIPFKPQLKIYDIEGVL